MTSIATHAERALIVEDELLVSRDIQRMLRSAGHSVAATAGSSRSAAEWLREHTPDLALVDISLPEGRLAGVELAEQLRSRGTPVVFVTAHVDRDTMRRAKGVGPAGYVVKPFTEPQLLAAVEMALDHAGPQPLVTARQVADSIASIEARLGRLTSMLATAGLPVDAELQESAQRRVEALRDLSTREREVLRLLLANRRVPHIAERLFISPHTVRTHLKAIFKKLKVHSQAELIDQLSREDHPAN